MSAGWVVTLGDASGHQSSLITTAPGAPVNPDVSALVDDLDAAHAAAIHAGLEIIHPLTTLNHGAFAGSVTVIHRDESSTSAPTPELPGHALA